MGQDQEKAGSNGSKKPVVFIKTFGCQMNQYDTEVAEGLLQAAGYEIVQKGESSTMSFPRKRESTTHGSPLKACGDDTALEADIVLLNTCSVREHAEDRVYGRLGMLGKAKKENPNLIVGLMGCMVEEHREKLFRRFPQLDLMLGTRNIKELPALIDEVAQTRRQVARIKQEGISIEYTDLIKRHGRFHAWLPIMTGCNKVCTFCIVPVTRGAEVSMPAREVYRETSRLVSEGVKWITLLGQNVNSYRGDGEVILSSPHALSGDPKSGFPIKTFGNDKRNVPGTNALSVITSPLQAGEAISGSEIASSALRPPRNDGCAIGFPELLETLCQIDGLERISFTTSHPSDATEDLFQVIARNPKISRRFHLPLQSGSNRILKRMKRLHTYQTYKDKIDLMRALIPDVSVTTDIIAGFSGETEEDHEATIRALEEIRYDGAYIYKYSVRPSTPASKLPDDVPIKVKERRNAELLRIQKETSKQNNRRFLGRTVEVFVEEISPKNPDELLGRTHEEKKVVFQGEKARLGGFQKVSIQGLRGETLMGTPLA